MRIGILIFSLAFGMVTPPAFSQQVAATDTNDVYATRHNHVLAFPKYVWNALIYPLGQFTIWVEHEEVPERVVDLFTNEAESFGLFPYAALGGETGTGAGFTTFHTDLFGRGKEMSASLVANADNQSWQAMFNDPGIGGGGWYWNASIAALATDREKATINGQLRGTGSRFEYEQGDLAFTIGRHTNYGKLEDYASDRFLELRLKYGLREYDAMVSGGGLPIDTFPGADQEIGMFSIGARLALDDRDFKQPTTALTHSLNYQLPGRVLLFADDHYYSLRDIAFPEHGNLLQVEADYVTGSDDVRFLRYAADAQRFFTLFCINRILGLRVRLEKAHALGDDSIIPYSDLTTLGGSQRLRGYKRGSFRGEGSLLLSAEYRYPIWDTWNAFLFWDEGQVFNEYGDIEVGEFKSNFGAGVSLRTESAFLLGLRIAHSEAEDALVGFSLEQEF